MDEDYSSRMELDRSRAADRSQAEAEGESEGRAMALPSRTATTMAVLVGLAVSVGVAGWLLVEQELNLLAPLIYGLLAGGGTWVAILLWTNRRNSHDC